MASRGQGERGGQTGVPESKRRRSEQLHANKPAATGIGRQRSEGIHTLFLRDGPSGAIAADIRGAIESLQEHLGLGVEFQPARLSSQASRTSDPVEPSGQTAPIRLSDGEVYGILRLCAHDRTDRADDLRNTAGAAPDRSVDHRGLEHQAQEHRTLEHRTLEHRTLAAFAGLLARRIDRELGQVREHAGALERIETVLAAGQPAMLYQPVYGMTDLRIDGAEALARFAGLPARGPDRWFAEAATVGRALALERQAIRNAVEGFRILWGESRLHLGLNCSPNTILAGELPKLWRGCPADRIVLEITEHEHVEDYPMLVRALQPLRAEGVKLAIDDAGSGYASMRHILNIAPEIIKLDVSLTSGIAADRLKRAMAHALIEFGQQTGCRIVAEGVETAEELRTLRELGVHAAQGYHLGHPMAAEDLCRLCETETPAVRL